MEYINTSIYNMSKELSIPPIASFCAKAMIRCFKKWKDSSCIISHLVKKYTYTFSLFMDEKSTEFSSTQAQQ